MKRLLFALLLCTGAAAAFGAEPSNEITPENVVALMNVYRADAGLPPLHVSDKLNAAATDRMHDMEDGGWWSHHSPEGTSPFVWLTVRDYDYVFAAENLAAGFETARLLVQTWIESPGHRANILGAQYSECGVAIIDGSTKGPAMGKSIVVLFARPKVALVSESVARRP